MIRVALTHFVLSTYERTVRLPISLPNSCLSRLTVKPKAFTFSWKIFGSTRPLMLSPFPRKARSACSFSFLESRFSSVWSSVFLLHALTPTSSFSTTFTHFDSVPSHDLVIWTDGSFHVKKRAPTLLPTAHLVTQRPPFVYFDRPGVFKAFLRKPAPFCKLFAGLHSTSKSAIFRDFSDSRCVLATFSFYISFLSYILL